MLKVENLYKGSLTVNVAGCRPLIIEGKGSHTFQAKEYSPYLSRLREIEKQGLIKMSVVEVTPVAKPVVQVPTSEPIQSPSSEPVRKRKGWQHKSAIETPAAVETSETDKPSEEETVSNEG